MPGRDGGRKYEQFRDLMFYASTRDGRIHVDLAMTQQPESVLGAARAKEIAADPNSGLIVKPDKQGGESRLYTEELNAKELYPMMFDHFEEVAKRNNRPVKGIDGQFAFENAGEIMKALENPENRARYVVREFDDGSMELKPEVLKFSKTWKFWEAYIERKAAEGYRLKPTKPVEFRPDEGFYWQFDFVK
jgi:hypothetical protein